MAFVLSASLPTRANGEWSKAASGAAPLHVMDLTKESDRDQVASQIARILGRDVVLDPPAALLADSLRWVMPDPDQSTCPETCSYLTDRIARMDIVRPPKTHGEVFAALLRLAEKEIELGDGAAAHDALEQALAIVPCSFAVIPPIQVRQVFLLKARAALLLHERDQARVAMANVLSVDPSFHPPASAPETWRALYASLVAHGVGTARPIDRTGLVDKAFLDGKPVTEVDRILPGTHILQVVSPFGEVRSTVFAIVAAPGKHPASAGVVLASLDDFGLPTRSQVLEILSNNLILGRINSMQVIGIERYLSRTGGDVVAFLVEPVQDDYSGLRFYQLDVGLSDTPPPSWAPAEKRGGKLLERLRRRVKGGH